MFPVRHELNFYIFLDDIQSLNAINCNGYIYSVQWEDNFE
jgi:hypothetical protein